MEGKKDGRKEGRKERMKVPHRMVLDDRMAFVEDEERSVFEVEEVVLEDVEEDLRGHDQDVVLVQLLVPPLARPIIHAIRAHVGAHI